MNVLWPLDRFAICLLALSLLGMVLAPFARGQVTFFTPPTYTGAATFVADFNGDGKLDMLGSDGTLNLGNGDGTFKLGTPVTGGALAVADFSGDGKPDVLQQGTGTLLVLLGNGDGTFQSPITTPTALGMLIDVATADLRGDGKPDVLALYDNSLVVFLGKGDGTFAADVSYPVGNSSFGTLINLGDFNGDHNIDVAVSLAGGAVAGSVVVLLGNGDGTFQPGKTSTGAYTPASAVAGDFNSDGKLDLIVYDKGACFGNCSPSSTLLLLGNGDGTFQPPATAFSGGGSLATADLNGDGKLDLVVASSLIQIYLGSGNGTFTNPYNYEPNNGSFSGSGLAVADFTSDGKLDIAAEGLVFLGNGNGSFLGQPAVPVPVAAFAAVAGAFDSNGAQDIAALSDSGPQNLYIILNDGTGVLTLAHTYMLPGQAVGLATADLNGDGKPDLVVIGGSNNGEGYSVLLGNGDGSFQPPVFYLLGVSLGESAIVIADFNNDHKPDLAISETAVGAVAVLLGNGDGTFGSPTSVYDGGGSSLVTADFNGDGKMDLASAGASGLAMLLGNGDGTFQPVSFSQPTLSALCCAGDLNGDSKVDLVGGSGYIQVLLGNGNGTFKALSPFGSTGYLGSAVSSIADMNGDGIPDLAGFEVIGSGFRSVADGVFLGNGDGTFSPFIQAYFFSADGPAQALFEVVADMNGDGKPDLVLGSATPNSATGDPGNVFVLLNTTVPVAPDFAIAPASGSSSSATISAGQKATFNLTVTPAGSFRGTVTLSCSITPIENPAPTCSLPSSVNVTIGTPTPVTVTIATTAPVAAGTVSGVNFPSGTLPFAWILILLS
jgi:hypothetical protein